ncbi:MAG: hypothetical protein R2854_26225 [Caldilineaceae bacterium]
MTSAHLRHLLDAVHQIRVRGVAFVDDRRTLRVAGVDQHVDLVAARHVVAPAGRHGRRVLLLFVAEKVGQTVAHVLLDGFEMTEDVGQIFVFLLQVVQQVVDDKAAHFLVQFMQPRTELAPQRGTW